MEIPQIPMASVPWLTAGQMLEVDRLTIEEVGIQLVQMMENAGRNLADLTLAIADASRVVVLAGPGGNGGGGLVAARHLVNRDTEVHVVLATHPDHLRPVTRLQHDILADLGVRIEPAPPPDAEGTVVLDALLGYSLHGNPRDRIAELIAWANARTAVIALDTPSGLDVTTGEKHDPCVTATATMTLALPKTGLGDSDVVGALYLADISVPATVYERMGIPIVAPFSDGPLVRLV